MRLLRGGIGLKLLRLGDRKVVDETKNTFTIETEKGIKKLLKAGIKLKISFGSRKAIIDGNLLVARPEERLKKRFKI